ncbi:MULTISPECIES: porin [Paraburkholderia]|uniref:porin n=1 Tax=Paraburkholderia TaxID=1822464 RepID=UPI0003822ABB|nr:MULTISPECIES: porin [Paraburkholderia]MDH6147560.1 putative porin [Paraburkholderia sp. WSM4179]
MRKGSIIWLAAAAVGAPSAYAQSSVTLYGVVDTGINVVTNAQTAVVNGIPVRGGTQITLNSITGLSGDRFGFLGKEDLGGGVQAVFQLENGFLVNNGMLSNGGAMFGRQAWVGLSNRMGTLTMGRQYDPLSDTVGSFVAGRSWAGYVAAHPDDLDNTMGTRRVNNSIKAVFNATRNLTVEGMYSLGGVSGSVARQSLWSAAASYTASGFQAALAYLNARNPNLSYFGTNANAAGASGNNLGSAGSATAASLNPVYAGFASAGSLNVGAAAVSYTLGKSTVAAIYTRTMFSHLGDVATSGPNPMGYSGSAGFSNVELNYVYHFAPDFLAGLAGNYTRGSSVGGHIGAIYRQINIGVDYFLSKRTDVYGLAGYQHASGLDSFGRPAVASIANVTAASGQNEATFQIGLRHKF